MKTDLPAGGTWWHLPRPPGPKARKAEGGVHSTEGQQALTGPGAGCRPAERGSCTPLPISPAHSLAASPGAHSDGVGSPLPSSTSAGLSACTPPREVLVSGGTRAIQPCLSCRTEGTPAVPTLADLLRGELASDLATTQGIFEGNAGLCGVWPGAGLGR